jgi:hypothetical protein
MEVFFSGRLIVIETNLTWAIPYWEKRKATNKAITWRFKC